MSDRTISLTPDQQALKSATKSLVQAYGGQQAAAARLGERQQRISDLGLPNTPNFARIDEVAILEDETHGCIGHPHVTHALARRQGYALVKLPQITATGSDLLKLLAVQSKEAGDIANEICTSIADGNIDQHEASKIRKENWELIRNAIAMDAELQMIERGL